LFLQRSHHLVIGESFTGVSLPSLGHASARALVASAHSFVIVDGISPARVTERTVRANLVSHRPSPSPARRALASTRRTRRATAS